ncbi:replication protein A, subunit RPA32 [Eremomyces bilateralis CBS 781.70]|uniref:Replication protein A, subunit RPA32 n=1 Tax=Eremomyces bilateralis CBS 781.70 TaxID=1392243 RepID=A0A6G1GFY3_9PEZI|nr:replication protein A, subunit RPA32 [Eremomyces bilateralis CBS 781.70]KAF1816779.1 replication protein A, subunit RPA32 [Eremomyces bilateralis CBS 781.70]
MANGSQTSPGSASKAYAKDTLRPVTIKQILDAKSLGDDQFEIDGAAIGQVTFVAQIRNISTQATNVTYKVEDGTGGLDVKYWLDTEKQEMDAEGKKSSALVENGYCRVFGKLKEFNGKKHVGTTIIRAVTDLNEIQYHLLEATSVHMYFTKGPLDKSGIPKNATSGAQNAGVNNDMNNATNTGTGPQVPPGSSTRAKKLFAEIQSSGVTEGLHIHDLATRMRMNLKETQDAAEELAGLGLIFTTVDDSTWAILDM